MGSKKKATKKDQFAQPHNAIDDGFAAMSKEFQVYKDEKLKFYAEQGIAIDVSSHEQHWLKAFTLGKLAQLQELINGKKEGTKNVKKPTKRKASTTKKSKSARKTKRKKRSGSSRRKPAGGQLEFSV